MAATNLTEERVLADGHQLMIVRLTDRKAEVCSHDVINVGKHYADKADVCSSH